MISVKDITFSEREGVITATVKISSRGLLSEEQNKNFVKQRLVRALWGAIYGDLILVHDAYELLRASSLPENAKHGFELLEKAHYLLNIPNVQ